MFSGCVASWFVFCRRSVLPFQTFPPRRHFPMSPSACGLNSKWALAHPSPSTLARYPHGRVRPCAARGAGGWGGESYWTSMCDPSSGTFCHSHRLLEVVNLTLLARLLKDACGRPYSLTVTVTVTRETSKKEASRKKCGFCLKRVVGGTPSPELAAENHATYLGTSCPPWNAADHAAAASTTEEGVPHNSPN